MRVWLLVSPGHKEHWYECRRMLHEIKKKNFDGRYMNPDLWTVIDNKMYVDGKVIQPPNLILMRHAVWNTSKLKHLSILEKQGTFIINKVEPHIDALDKITSTKKYIAAGIPIPKTIEIDLSRDDAADIISDKLGWPCVIKWSFAASSEKVFLCHSPDDFYKIIADRIQTERSPLYKSKWSMGNLSSDKSCNLTFLAQEFLELDYMITAHAIRDKSIQATIQTIPPKLRGIDKFKANFSNMEGRTQLPLKTTNDMQDLINKTLHALDIEWGRVDIFPTKDGLKICEVNPGGNYVMTECCSLTNRAGLMLEHALDKMKLNTQ